MSDWDVSSCTGPPSPRTLIIGVMHVQRVGLEGIGSSWWLEIKSIVHLMLLVPFIDPNMKDKGSDTLERCFEGGRSL